MDDDDCIAAFLCYGWQCHICNAITSLTDWGLAWNNHTPEFCTNENCTHQRCGSCSDINDMGWPLQHCDGSVIQERVEDQELSRTPDDQDAFEAMEVAIMDEPGEPDILTASEATVDGPPRGETSGPAEEATADAARDFHTEAPRVAAARRWVPCPFTTSRRCNRTFSHRRYANSHARVHTHHMRCPHPSCRARFAARDTLEAHLQTSHGCGDIADLDPSVHGPLLRVADGKYRCRFKALLGCDRVFAQNGHANRHSLRHCRSARRCNVLGCAKRFMRLDNWQAHFWAAHFLEID